MLVNFVASALAPFREEGEHGALRRSVISLDFFHFLSVVSSFNDRS